MGLKTNLIKKKFVMKTEYKKRLIKDRKDRKEEVFVLRHGYYERITEPFNKIIEYLLKYVKESYSQVSS